MKIYVEFMNKYAQLGIYRKNYKPTRWSGANNEEYDSIISLNLTLDSTVFLLAPDQILFSIYPSTSFDPPTALSLDS